MAPDQHPGWMRLAACPSRLDLPWLADTEQVSAWEVIGMRSVCATCPVFVLCRAHVHATGVTGGWWAGTDRDPNSTEADQVPAFWDAA